TLLDVLVRRDFQADYCVDIGSLSELISMGFDFGGNPDWPSGIYRRRDLQKMLLAAGSPLSSDCQRSSVLDRAAAMVNDEKIHALLINELAARRRELLKLSQRLLPRRIFENLTSSLRGLPDVEAFPLINALIDAGDNTDRNYWCYSDASVYGAEYGTVQTAELLFAAGFTDLEQEDSNGFTILILIAMSIPVRPEETLKILWLLSKGVSLRRPVQTELLREWLIPSVNFVSAIVGQVLGEWTEFAVKDLNDSTAEIEDGSAYDRINTEAKEVLQHVLASEYLNCRDACQCSCSLEGCTPLVMLWKGWASLCRHLWLNSENSPFHELHGKFIEWTLTVLPGNLTAPEVTHLSQSALRFRLFQDLRLRHLCCRSYALGWRDGRIMPPIEAAEAREIKEEDKFRKERFDSLLPKAEAEYQQSFKSFSEFWSEFYNDNIANSEQEDDLDDHVRSVIEIGVEVTEPDQASSSSD
ncbi:MAG: hypothetical protein Q9181_007495, partial [Wetmoreana brouardii]